VDRNVPRLDAIEILIVCTGNACRSPMAAALLQQRLTERGSRARVTSAGTRPWNAGATADAIAVMRGRGLDISEHRNLQLDSAVVARADLVLGMAREHVALVVDRSPDAADRAFVIGELARLGHRVGARVDGEPVRAWLARVTAARPADRPLGRAADEVADPAGEPIALYRETARVLDGWLTIIADLVVGKASAARIAGT
jgi:protein-tyrosine phosphatase